MDNVSDGTGPRIAGRLGARMAAHAPPPGLPTADEATRAVDEARRMFHRALASWVCDLLALRKSGMTRPRWLPGHGEWNEAA